jgi:UDP:flavonoid glycosyltransferase YjiC (YdhE family)
MEGHFVRILFTFVGGAGHALPLIPIARAAENRGHAVAFTGHSGMAATIQNEGFTCFSKTREAPATPQRRPLLPVSREREEQDLRERFARQAAGERAREILDVQDQWQPDVIVCDEVDFGSMTAAERRQVPYASVLVIAAGSLGRREVIGGPLHELRVAHGLPPDPELKMLSRYLVLSPFPPSYRDPAFPLPATAHTIRPLTIDCTPGDVMPPWFDDLPNTPIVYFTLGTEFNLESGDLFARVLAGLSELPISLVVTVGRQIDPAEFAPQPANVHIERYILQATLLPRCTATVSHGGSGSVMGALAHGLPMVLIPMGADQPLNGDRCAALGVARVLDPIEASPEGVRAAVVTVLTDPTYRRRAEQLRDEIAVLPGPDYALDLLERLVVETAPLRSG